MPIIKPTPSSTPFFYPKNEYVIAKYMDLTKFLSMLFTHSLFFCRVDKLEDQFEGNMSIPTIDLLKQFLKQPLEDDGKESQATSDENFKDIMSHQKR